MTDAAQAVDESPAPAEPPAPLPSVPTLLRRAPAGFVVNTLVIGLGVATAWCAGFGLLLMWAGSAGLLQHAAHSAGAKGPRMPALAGFIALVLATLLAAAGALGALVVGYEDLAGAAACVVSAAIMGGALAPLAMAPIASACGTRGPLAPIVRATDIAGADRLLVLAPLCALISVALVVPIPLVSMGISGVFAGDPSLIALGLVAFVVWVLAVPISAAVLTLRYLRLERRNDVPTRLSQALAPVLGAFAIGLVALGASLGAASATPSFVRSSAVGDPPASSGQLIDTVLVPIEGTDLRAASFGDDGLMVEGPTAHHRIPTGSWWPRCEAHPRADGGAVFRCERAGSDGWIEVDAEGAPVAVDIGERLATRVGAFVGAAFGLALLTLALALLWLGRIGVSLRLLASPPFTLAGALRVTEDAPRSDGTLAFEASDGGHRVRVPASRVAAPPGWTPSDGQRAVLLSHAHVDPMGFRTAYADCPADALLVVGAREDTLGHAIRRARRIGFRLGVVALSALVGASVAVLLAL